MISAYQTCAVAPLVAVNFKYRMASRDAAATPEMSSRTVSQVTVVVPEYTTLVYVMSSSDTPQVRELPTVTTPRNRNSM